MYSWNDVAIRTVRVYNAASASQRDASLLRRMRRFWDCGPYGAGAAFAALAAVGHVYWRWLEWWLPAAEVEVAVDIPKDAFQPL